MRESYLDVPSQYSLFRDIISNDSFQSLTLRQLLKCNDRPLLMKRFRRGKYWIMENVVVGRKSRHMGCADSITFTTHGDYSFVDSLETLVGRWLAPISLAIFAPGHDIIATLEAIQYVRNCVPKSDLVSDFVTFHIYFPYRHMPEYVPLNETEALEYPYSCAATDIIFGKPSNMNRPREEMYRLQQNLSYPINVGRNIARTAANTHFIFACDLQLFPSLGFVDQFLDMVDRNHSILLLDPKTQQPRVYPVPVFELRNNESLPNNKTELLEQVPDQKRWLRRNPNLTDELQVFSVSTRTGKFRSWEPFYVSDNAEPLFDEKVSWEGQSSKRVQVK
ncbi:beta-1,4-glucuronyltransferase 1-like [Scaptodrosophila lebanonensis]|uniref:Beta-1,4-glucuronyltransferase 1-like n=1 Tax=Drosophila lebanonensis TaxID=7225 RepID=A0A6J2U1A3_DROLE|nr:beta-1,4-glucuronyltransferase 1-like [Scaptodrosophila lebanonensis]